MLLTCLQLAVPAGCAAREHHAASRSQPQFTTTFAMDFEKKYAKRDLNHNTKHFKHRLTFEKRKVEAMAIRTKFPTKVPLIIQKYKKEMQLPTLDKAKFLVPEDITMSQFLVIIRHRIKLNPNQALYLIIGNRSMLSMSLTMSQAYAEYASEDGFLYITYASQEVFGYQDDIGSAQEVEAIRHRFPNKVPLYVDQFARDRDLPPLTRKKYLVPQELTMSQFLYIIRKKLKIRDTQALYLLANDRVLVTNSLTMAQAYEQFRSPDGYLHLTYASLQTFGAVASTREAKPCVASHK